jgi:hypothetical protein
MHARDIPVVGGLLDAAILYGGTLARIARHPFRFVHSIAFAEPEEPRRALKFLGAAIAFGYLIMSPALARHGFKASQMQFGVVVLLRLALITGLYHVAFLVAGYRQPVAKSLILSSYINGVYFPLLMAIMLPGYLAVGPHSFFDPLSGPSTPEDLAAAQQDPAVLAALTVLLVAYPFFFAVTSTWWARAFAANIWVSAALLVAAVLLAGLGNTYVMPLITRLFV